MRRSSFFDKLESCLRAQIKVERLEYAGHGARRKEAFYQNFAELSGDMYAQVKERWKPEEAYGLFGYSMGSIAVVEVLKRILLAQEIDPPCHVFLGAHGPAMKRELREDSQWESDEWVKKRTIEFGGIPESLVENRAFWRVYLPQYQADYRLIRRYPFDKMDIACRIPATVFYSETDTPFPEIRRWTQVFQGSCKFIEYPGTHFFIIDHWPEAAEIVKAELAL